MIQAIWAWGKARGKLRDESSCFVQVLSIPYILIWAMSYSLVQWHFTECLWLGSDRMLSCAVTGSLKQQAIQDAKWKWADCAISMATVWSNRGGWGRLERSEKKNIKSQCSEEKQLSMWQQDYIMNLTKHVNKKMSVQLINAYAEMRWVSECMHLFFFLQWIHILHNMDDAYFINMYLKKKKKKLAR